MCLITRQKTPTILEEDMVVYKRMNKSEKSDEFYSSSIGFKYVLGRDYKTEMVYDKKPDSYADFIVSDHYQFYGPGQKGFKEVASKMTNVHEGFHFYTTKKRSDICFQSFHGLIECIIPKGSEVFLDETGLGVSNRILINKVLKK